MKTINFFLTITIILLIACQKENSDQADKLNKTGILGIWEINGLEINGVMDMSVRCCEFVEFKDDDQTDDYDGEYKSYGSGYESSGFFTLNPNDSTLSFGDSANQTVYNYLIQNDYLTFSYKLDGDNFTETWIKIE